MPSMVQSSRRFEAADWTERMAERPGIELNPALGRVQRRKNELPPISRQIKMSLYLGLRTFFKQMMPSDL